MKLRFITFQYCLQYCLLSFFILILAGCTAPIIQYAKNGQYLDLQKEIDKGADLNSKDIIGETALMKAAEYHPQAIAPLIAAGADINATNLFGRTALMSALPESIPELVAAGINVNAKGILGETALILAAQFSPQSITPLINVGANINAQTKTGKTALIKAAESNYKSIAPLLDAGANVLYKDNRGFNALMLVIRSKYRKNRRYESFQSFLSLLSAGSDINAKNNKGQTALMYALKYRPKAVNPLIEAGSDVNIRKYNGWTALMYAAQYSPESIPLLISSGADTNARTNQGWTALMYAALYKRQEVKALLEAGAETEPESMVKTKAIPAGSTALDIAKITKEPEIIQLLTARVEERRKEDQSWIHAITRQNYNNYLFDYPTGKYSKQATDNISRQKNENILIAKLKAQQRCKLIEDDWFYTSKACNKGYANGFGSAANGKGLIFEGTLKEGVRINGKLYLDEKLMYDGPIKNNRPHGHGQCMLDEKPEPCEYSNGDRIDAPFVERIEKQRLALEAQKNKHDTGSVDYLISYIARQSVDKLIKEAFHNLF